MAKTSKFGVLVLLIFAIVVLFLNTNEDGVFGGMGIFLISIFLGLLTSFAVLINDLLEFKISKSIKSLLPTITCVIIISLTNYRLSKTNQPSNLPILIQAGYSPGVGATSLILYSDNTYEYFNGAFLSSNTSKGTYILKDSSILLDRTKVDKALISNNLLIISQAKIIYQMDSIGNRLVNAIPFVIHIDNRIK